MIHRILPLVALVAPYAAEAAAPELVPVTGYLTDGTGPLDGPVTLHLKLYATANAAATDFEWEETQTITVDNGQFTVYLGAETALDLALFDANSALYLGIAVESGAEMTPRFTVATAPYAAYAQYCDDAATVGGIDPADILTGTQGVDWGQLTNVPAALLDGDQDTLYTSGTGLSLSGGAFSLDQATVDTYARAVAYDTLGELQTDLDGVYLPNISCLVADQVLAADGIGGWLCSDVNDLPIDASQIAIGVLPYGRLPVGTAANTVAAGNHAHTAADVGALPIGGGTLTGPLAVTGSVRLGDQALTCGAGAAGTLRYVDNTLELCNGTEWISFLTAHGVSRATALPSCKAILDRAAGAPLGSGAYWVDPDGGDTANAVRAYCDMTTDGGGWTRFWMYTQGEVIPSGTDMLGGAFGSCAPESPTCFAKLPAALVQNNTQLLARDTFGTVYRWQFAASNSTSAAAWRAFHDGSDVPAGQQVNGAAWSPTVIAGAFHGTAQDSFMYRTEHGVKSFLMDDDNCDCMSTLSGGHGMCGASWSASYSTEFSYGADMLNDGACRGPVTTTGLQLFYR